MRDHDLPASIAPAGPAIAIDAVPARGDVRAITIYPRRSRLQALRSRSTRFRHVVMCARSRSTRVDRICRPCDRDLRRRRPGCCALTVYRLPSRPRPLVLSPARRSRVPHPVRSAGACFRQPRCGNMLQGMELIRFAWWHLSEDATAIWQEPPLVNEKTGRPRHEFDHLPIMGALRSPAHSSVQGGS